MPTPKTKKKTAPSVEKMLHKYWAAKTPFAANWVKEIHVSEFLKLELTTTHVYVWVLNANRVWSNAPLSHADALDFAETIIAHIG